MCRKWPQFVKNFLNLLMFHVFVILYCNSLLLTIQFPVTLTHQKCRVRFRSCCHQLSSLTEVTVFVMCCTNVCQRSVAHCIRLCTFVACLKPLGPSHLEVLSTVRVPVHVWQSRAASLRLLALWSLELDRVWSHTRASSLAIIYTLAVFSIIIHTDVKHQIYGANWSADDEIGRTETWRWTLDVWSGRDIGRTNTESDIGHSDNHFQQLHLRDLLQVNVKQVWIIFKLKRKSKNGQFKKIGSFKWSNYFSRSKFSFTNFKNQNRQNDHTNFKVCVKHDFGLGVWNWMGKRR